MVSASFETLKTKGAQKILLCLNYIGRWTRGLKIKEKLAAQRHATKVGRRVVGELKRIERQIVDAAFMPDD